MLGKAVLVGLALFFGCASAALTPQQRLASSLWVYAENTTVDPVDIALTCDSRKLLPEIWHLTVGRMELQRYDIGLLGCRDLRVEIKPTSDGGPFTRKERFRESFIAIPGCSAIRITANSHLPTSTVLPLQVNACPR